MLYAGDNLEVLRQQFAAASVNLIYADPPFNSGHPYYTTGKREQGPSFHDTWRWDDAAFEQSRDACPPRLQAALNAVHAVLGPGADTAYCAFLAPRLAEFQRVLTPGGSLYLHCDVRMSHCLRLLLDALFGRANFRNEIVWAYRTGGAGKRQFARKHDAILFYSASADYVFHAQYERVRYAKPFFQQSKTPRDFLPTCSCAMSGIYRL